MDNNTLREKIKQYSKKFEKAKSKSQRNLMGTVYAYKKGEITLDDLPSSLADKVKDIANSISTKDAKDYAGTDNDEIPEEDKLIQRDKEDDPDLIEPDDDRNTVIKEYSQSERNFFKRPLINKAFTRLKRIWQKGGKKNEHLLYNDIKKEKELLAPMITEIIPNKDYQRFLRKENYRSDINDTFLKAIYMYFNGIAKIDNGGDVEERQLDRNELRDIYNSLNVYRFHVFIESIIKFRKHAFKEPVIND